LFTLFVVPAMYMMLGADHGGAAAKESGNQTPSVTQDLAG